MYGKRTARYRNLTLFAGLAFLTAAAVPARSPQVHRLEATPATVVYGYYWSEAAPALRIASGDVIDVDTLLTNTPEGLAKAGVPDDHIQDSLKEIVSQVTGDRRGPGGHILAGPVYVEGAQPGDVLEVKIQSIDLAIDYGYNGCKGILPENCEPNAPVRIVALDRHRMTAQFAPGIVIPLRPFFGSMGGGACTRGRTRQQQSARAPCRQSRQSRAGGRQRAVYPDLCPRRPVRGR